MLIRQIIKQLVLLMIVGLVAGGLVNCTRMQKTKLEIPNERWVSIYFEHEGLASKSINQLTREANMANLRTLELPGDDLEVRVWNGFALNGVDGLVLRRSSGQWWKARARPGRVWSPGFESPFRLAPSRSGKPSQ